MPTLKCLYQVLLALLPLWPVSAVEDDVHERLLFRREAQLERLHQARNLAQSSASSSASASLSGSISASVASDSSSSSSYVPSWAASSTFAISVSVSSSFAPRPTPASCGLEDCKFYNDDTAPYFVTEWPETNFDVGESYGGSTPIDESDPSRTLFWIFKPKKRAPVDEVTIWLNGGPGCSSLEGFLQENGPISWQQGQFHTQYNTFHWGKFTNMLWVEQPVGVGFSQGQVRAQNEYDVATEFLGFFKNWERLFGIKNYKIYFTGESYAGVYIPYISAAMLDQKDKTYFDVSGALMYDACIGDCGIVQGWLPGKDFVLNNQCILNFNQSLLSEMIGLSASCGLDAYMDKYLHYPPPENQPTEHGLRELQDRCALVFTWMYEAIVSKNPCFNAYHIIDVCPPLSDPLALYWNRPDVKKAIHAPVNVTWHQCTWPFKGRRDDVPLSLEAALPQVIDATKRVLVSNGDWDGFIYTNGTLLSIQNMTWGEKLGFQHRPSKVFEVPIAINDYGYTNWRQGAMGIAHYERGLMWVETNQAGHQVPQYQPRAAWQHLSWVLGRINTLRE